LTEADRLPWLQSIAAAIDEMLQAGDSAVLGCSALKRAYRDVIIGDRPQVALVYLKGSYDLIRRRIEARRGHFMPASLLESQFQALQEPTADEHPIVADITPRPAEITRTIQRELSAHLCVTRQAR
jgi:carbohydrate kinase (thermoresistant glucokinase family)